ISSGDNLTPSAINHLLEQVTVYNTYGGPENTVFSTAYCCNEGVSLPTGHYPLGRPVDGVKVMILDDDLKPVAPGKIGEICFSGEFVADGYVGDHRNEQRALTTLEDGTRIYRTGDLGRMLSDGNVAYLRRKDSEVHILGKRVVTGEVERALMASDEVKDCFVMDYQDEKGAAYLVAYVVPQSSPLRLSWVRNKLAQYLPAYMIPEFFVLLRQLPVNAAGKVNPLALPVVLKDAIAG
ncbi:MAG: AMP-binding protein, partial [Duncaniella sp.]|nr:AMP-binding protein [Duncaniella sp.]